jgi:diguanylate cyclase (GGDEF)-like protein
MALALMLAALAAPPAAANGTDTAQALPLADPTPTLSGRALFLHAEAQADDDPRAALAALGQGPADEAPQHRAWRALAMAEVQTRLEDEAAAGQALAKAAQWMARAPVPDAEWQVRFELQSLLTGFDSVPMAQLQAHLAGLRVRLPGKSGTALHCELESVAVFLLQEAGSLDEAWRAAEEVEACGQALAQPRLVARALSGMGHMALATGGEAAADRAAALFDRASAALGQAPARFNRSLLAFDAGRALTNAGQPEQGRVHLQRALELSRALDDRAGVAAAQIAIAAGLYVQGRHADMLGPLDEASSALAEVQSPHRQVAVAEMRLRALAALNASPDPALAALAPAARLQQALAAADAVDRTHLLPQTQARLWQARAQALAALQQYLAAYQAMLQAQTQTQAARVLSRDSQVLQLQARYDDALRGAENAQLRHREETARLALEVQAARQRLLWAAVAGLAAVALGAGALLWRGLRKRRSLAELALRDELTGAPNRRAILAVARRHLEQHGVPPTLALIDLDHFKRVNDSHGHAAGDALLRALVGAAALELRAQDRLGRWGGEEWLLLLPGATAADLPAVFERLRRRFAAMPVPGLPHPHGATFSMGAVLPDGRHLGVERALDQALEAADRALYRAKAAGRDRLMLHGEALAPGAAAACSAAETGGAVVTAAADTADTAAR